MTGFSSKLGINRVLEINNMPFSVMMVHLSVVSALPVQEIELYKLFEFVTSFVFHCHYAMITK